MKIHRTLAIVPFALALVALPACDKKDDKKTDASKADKKEEKKVDAPKADEAKEAPKPAVEEPEADEPDAEEPE